MAQSHDAMMTKLNGAHTEGTSGSKSNGSHYEWDLRLKDLTSDIQTDIIVQGMRVEKFIINGHWESRVRKDKYRLGVLYDKEWGDDKKPYGTFSVDVKSIDGAYTSKCVVQVEGFPDQPNSFASGKVYDWIKAMLHS